jgi:soluble lytic murein transglycosylase-like protein
VIEASKQAHVPSRLVTAVVQVENGGDFIGSAHRVSSAGAIGVMQLEPATAWGALHVNPWDVRENIEIGTG